MNETATVTTPVETLPPPTPPAGEEMESSAGEPTLAELLPCFPGATRGITKKGGVKIYFLASVLETDAGILMRKARELGMAVKTPMSALSAEEVERVAGALFDSAKAAKARALADPRLPAHYLLDGEAGGLDARTPAARLALSGDNPMAVDRNHPRLQGLEVRWISDEVCARRGLRGWTPLEVSSDKEAREIAPNVGGFTNRPGSHIRFGGVTLAVKSAEDAATHRRRLKEKADGQLSGVLVANSAEGEDSRFRGATRSELEFYGDASFGRSLGGAAAGPSIDRQEARPLRSYRMGVPQGEGGEGKPKRRTWSPGYRPGE